MEEINLRDSIISLVKKGDLKSLQHAKFLLDAEVGYALNRMLEEKKKEKDDAETN